MTLTAVITLILLLLIGAGLAFRSRGKEGKDNNSRTLTLGLVLFGLGLFGLLNYPFAALYAAIAVVAVLLVVPWAITGSIAAMMQGVIAVVVIVVLGLLFRLTPAEEWLSEAIITIGSNSSDLGGIVTDWLPEPQQPQP